jgi:hypothetical protein
VSRCRDFVEEAWFFVWNILVLLRLCRDGECPRVFRDESSANGGSND